MMRPPDEDKSNGIIIGYFVFFSERITDEGLLEEFCQKVPRSDDKHGYTKTVIKGLKIFQWYQFEVIAYNRVANGSRTGKFHYIQTDEGGKCRQQCSQSCKL